MVNTLKSINDFELALFLILEYLDENPFDKKSFSLVCKTFRKAESRHRNVLRPLRPELLIKIINRYPYVTNLNLSAMGIKDLNVAAIASGCPRLEMINLGYCKKITDMSLVSLSKCSRLSVVEIQECSSISSTGITSISIGCKLLTELDVKKCHMFNDVGLLSLTNFSHNLKQDSAALAKITRSRSITILHLRGFSTHGLVVALLACSGLRTRKLHELFKSLFPQSFSSVWNLVVVSFNGGINHSSLNMKRTPMKVIQISSMPIDENITLKKNLKFIQISSMPIDENITLKKNLKLKVKLATRNLKFKTSQVKKKLKLIKVKLPRARSQLDKSIEFEHERPISGSCKNGSLVKCTGKRGAETTLCGREVEEA
ncbi:hypothetical protein Scep_027249 [Stephania cephalantha]|uniref:F-box/LRR-repeat protein 15-like leucin rich repeat domain-containing protein n=1 Tax=Stephania cephalantha TaxID=152367 RepID=A0AAP0HKL5_9MAGN